MTSPGQIGEDGRAARLDAPSALGHVQRLTDRVPVPGAACARREVPAATPMTATSPTSSANSPCKARTSASGGPPTTRPVPQRRPAVPPPARRRPHPQLRSPPVDGRHRPDARRVHRRTRLALTGGAEPSRELVGGSGSPNLAVNGASTMVGPPTSGFGFVSCKSRCRGHPQRQDGTRPSAVSANQRLRSGSLEDAEAPKRCWSGTSPYRRSTWSWTAGFGQAPASAP